MNKNNQIEANGVTESSFGVYTKKNCISLCYALKPEQAYEVLAPLYGPGFAHWFMNQASKKQGAA